MSRSEKTKIKWVFAKFDFSHVSVFLTWAKSTETPLNPKGLFFCSWSSSLFSSLSSPALGSQVLGEMLSVFPYHTLHFSTYFITPRPKAPRPLSESSRWLWYCLFLKRTLQRHWETASKTDSIHQPGKAAWAAGTDLWLIRGCFGLWLDDSCQTCWLVG